MSGEDRRRGDGLTVLDATALVIGAAVASVHVRGALLDRAEGVVWGLVLITFLGLATTSAGPFVCLARRVAGRPRPGPGGRPGEPLWVVLGLPWVIAAILRGLDSEATDLTLTLTLAPASLAAVAVVYVSWVIASPSVAAERSGGPWPNRVGLVLAVAWPLQWMFYLMVISPRVGGFGPPDG